MVETTPTVSLSSGRYNRSVPVISMSEPGLDVAACVERVRQRDEEAARRLMAHLYPLVLKLVRALLPRRTAEEDLVQTVFMKVFAKLDQYAGDVPLEHWVSRIVVNTCINQLRAERVRTEVRWADLEKLAGRIATGFYSLLYEEDHSTKDGPGEDDMYVEAMRSLAVALNDENLRTALRRVLDGRAPPAPPRGSRGYRWSE